MASSGNPSDLRRRDSSRFNQPSRTRTSIMERGEGSTGEVRKNPFLRFLGTCRIQFLRFCSLILLVWHKFVQCACTLFGPISRPIKKYNEAVNDYYLGKLDKKLPLKKYRKEVSGLCFCRPFLLIIIIIIFAIPAYLGYRANNSISCLILGIFACIPPACVMTAAVDALEERLGPVKSAYVVAFIGNCAELAVGWISIEEKQFFTAQASVAGSVVNNLFFMGPIMSFVYVCYGRKKNMRSAQKVDRLNLNTNLLQLLVYILNKMATMSSQLHGKEFSIRCFFSAILLVHYIAYTSQVAQSGKQQKEDSAAAEGENDQDERPIGYPAIATCIVVPIALIALIVYIEVESVGQLGKENPKYIWFINLIVLPFLSNAAEHLVCIYSAYKGNLPLAIAMLTTSVIQMLGFVQPANVIFATALGGEHRRYPLDLGDYPLIYTIGSALVWLMFVEREQMTDATKGTVLACGFVTATFFVFQIPATAAA